MKHIPSNDATPREPRVRARTRPGRNLVVLIAAAAIAAAALSLAATAAAAPLDRSTADASQLRAEHLIYGQLDALLDFVGALRVTSSGALVWSSVPGDDSGRIACTDSPSARFRCTWAASLIQSYVGVAAVTLAGHSSDVVFLKSTCTNAHSSSRALPNLCALDPVPGMAGT